MSVSLSVCKVLSMLPQKHLILHAAIFTFWKLRFILRRAGKYIKKYLQTWKAWLFNEADESYKLELQTHDYFTMFMLLCCLLWTNKLIFWEKFVTFVMFLLVACLSSVTKMHMQNEQKITNTTCITGKCVITMLVWFRTYHIYHR